MKYCKGMSIKKEKDVVNEKPSASNQEDSKTISYFKSILSSTPTPIKKEKQDKNEPTRFLGDGVSFKAKLIGILEVNEARGDRMCQEALCDLKMAIRAAGEHKQRINISIAIDGLRLRDEKTGDCLYHHPVHKISFIAQDMSDSRAFGYIFGSPDTGHRFFGIKTDKSASQVVITMRDLFQVVFELKKKEIEQAKQHIEQHQLKYSSPLFPELSARASADTLKIRTIEDTKGNASAIEKKNNQEHIMDLLDLELELNNIQQGINQMERITPSDPFGPSMTTKPSALDPFGDSFNPLQNRNKIPPPPETGKKNKNSERHWFDQETEALFEETELPSTLSSLHSSNIQRTFPISSASASASALPSSSELNIEDSLVKKIETFQREQFDVFTDLDPLGTGRSKPYVDKKDFFQNLKNPPKKVLKDLVSELPSDYKPSHSPPDSDSDSTLIQHRETKKSVKPPPVTPVSYADPFQSDPFDKDPFSAVDFSNNVFIPSNNSDPFEKFADFSSFEIKKEETVSEKIKSIEDESKTPLRVSLPPEKINAIDSVPMSPLQSRRANRLQKNNTITCLIKPPSPISKRNKLVSQPSLDQLERNSPIMEGVTIRMKNTSFYPSLPLSTFNDTTAPEPPPRSALNSLAMKPPPLPPKKLAISASSKPPPRPPQSDYDYIENYHTTSYPDVNSPPLPAPARKLKANQQKPSVEPEYYLQPFPLLPPPKKKNASPKEPSSDTSSKPDTLVKSSLDITLSQLTKTGFSDLAATLNMSPTSLSKMTLQDLTRCLSNLSSENQNKETLVGNNSPSKSTKTNILTSECYSALRESIEEDNVSFTAEFDSHFNAGNDFETKPEESLFDKYAVFRELLEEEKKVAISFDSNSEESHIQESSYNISSENLKIDIPSENEVKSNGNLVEDRYAALRDICIDEAIEEKYLADLSDKEDSVIEPSRLEEDTDLLPQSRLHSESTESPTVTMKDHQSIIEVTIMEEDISALEVDEEVLEESVDETLKESVDQPCENFESTTITMLETNEDIFSTITQPSNENKQSAENIKNDSTSWAKFEADHGTTVVENKSSIHSEGRVSPWSTESKDDLSPACSDKRKHRKIKRAKPPNLYNEDEESEEGWDLRQIKKGSWSPSMDFSLRENGWSDDESAYDDTPPYIEREFSSPRRGRRRRFSPWNSRDQSPWEEDDRNICDEQWEGSRWPNEPRQRPKHRGPSWEDERRRHYEDPRKPRKPPMMWPNEVDRKSSRESLNWEDEERYPKRNYGERRRRKWDDDFHNRNRWRDREWSDVGLKMSNRYYKERSHDHHWDVDYSDHADDETSRWPQRPRSCERSRRQFSLHHPVDPEFAERSSDRRYTRSRDGHCVDVDYRRKAHSHQNQKQRRKHSQNSPFEDDFTSQFGFQKEMCSPGGSEVFESDSKHGAAPFEANLKQFIKQPPKQPEFPQYSQTTSHGSEYSRETAKTSRSYQQSPFEDDFTPPEARRCSGRSASSELSDQKGSDDVFFSNPNENIKQKSQLVRHVSKNTIPTEANLRLKTNKKMHTGDHSNVSDQTKGYTQSDCDQADINSAQYINEGSNGSKVQGSIKRSDSSSSLRKSESVNIFARNNDPFDDEFFCEESTKTNHTRDKFSKNIISEEKWNESFDTFSFDDK